MNQVIEKHLSNEILVKYLMRMLEKNESINLTRVTDISDAKLLHLEDSLAVIEEFNAAPDGLYGDMGSGCGFPGVALAIASGRKTLLIDSVNKKMEAVKLILGELGLSPQIETNSSRIEDLAKEKPEEFAVLTARALSSLPSLLELASPLLKDKGQLIALKSHVSDEELNQAKSIQQKTGMRLLSSRDYYLSDGETFRSVYVFEKYQKPSMKLPRRVGMAQKNPLK